MSKFILKILDMIQESSTDEIKIGETELNDMDSVL